MNSNHPAGISGKYDQCAPNEEIYLSTETVVVNIDSEQLEIDGDLYLTLLPSPRLDLKLPLPGNTLPHRMVASNVPKEFRVDAFPDVQWIANGINGSTLYLLPDPQRVTTALADDINYAIFHLLNFYDFHSDGIQLKSQWKSGRVVLQDEQWEITIDATDSTTSNVKSLKNSGGYAITHVGKVARRDGSDYSSDDLERLLHDLMNFLSFARGFRATPILVTGYNQSDIETWTEWGIRETYSWKRVMSWFAPLHTRDMLPEAFCGYMNRIKEPNWYEAVKHAIYWYVQSNTLTAIDGALILAQTALESLSWNYLVTDQECLDEQAFGKINAANKIRLLLTFCNIPLNLPSSCKELTKIAKGRNLLDGPQSITFVRNNVVHPSKGSIVPRDAYWEALNLALGYIELVLLRLFEYQGKYSNRLDHKWADEVADVPWAKPIS